MHCMLGSFVLHLLLSCSNLPIIFIDMRTKWTTKVLGEKKKTGYNAWHFRRKFASPPLSPRRDKTKKVVPTVYICQGGEGNTTFLLK